MLRLVFPFPSLWRAKKKNAQEWSKNCGCIIQPQFLMDPTGAGAILRASQAIVITTFDAS